MSDTERINLTRDQFESLIADVMMACARAWLPDNPAHIGEASLWLTQIASTKRDATVQSMQAGIAAKLMDRTARH
jgi:hypothetical protein